MTLDDARHGGPYLSREDLDTTHTNNNSNNSHSTRRGLQSLSKTCFIQPKHTGLASFFLQFVLLIVSGITSMFFFYHVGGYEYMQWNENSTILEPVRHPFQTTSNPGHYEQIIVNESELEASTTTPSWLVDDSLVSTSDRSLELINKTIESSLINDQQKRQIDLVDYKAADATDDGENDAFAKFLDNLLGNDNPSENSTFGIEQVPMTSVKIGGVEFDWLEVIRISTLVYLAICLLWFFTIVFFICSVVYEILDAVIGNLIILALVIIYQFAHSILIAALLFFQTEMSWRTMAITIGSITILSCCSFLGCVCFALNCGWVKYIDHMHGKAKCICLSALIRLIKGKEARNDDRAEQNVNYNYGNDLPMQQFSAF